MSISIDGRFENFQFECIILIPLSLIWPSLWCHKLRFLFVIIAFSCYLVKSTTSFTMSDRLRILGTKYNKTSGTLVSEKSTTS